MNKFTLPILTDVPIRIGDIPVLVAGVLEPESKIQFSATRQAMIQLEYEKEIHNASMNGKLIGRNPLTNIQQPFAIGDQLNRSVLTISELSNFLSHFEISVITRPLPEESGRYTLIEAAQTISENTGEGEKEILSFLVDAVENIQLPVYWPGSKTPLELSPVREWINEVYWDDLNKWIESKFPRLSWRFPNPDKKQYKQNFQDKKPELRVKEIELAAKARFDDPMCIPLGGKSELREILCAQNSNLFTVSTFDAAWKKAKKAKLVEVENCEQYKVGK